MLNYPKRKNIRIKKYNYSQDGIYYITICTKNKKCILSKIDYKENNLDVKIELLYYGKIIEKYINNINNIYENVLIAKYIIMPNHIHFICEINKANIFYTNDFKNKTRYVNGLPRTSAPTKISNIVATLKRFCNKDIGNNIWQRNYYEHIIRNENEFLEIIKYIDNNPIKWYYDKYYIQ